MAFEHRKYVVIQYQDIDKINFNEVMETSRDTVRTSIDGLLTFVKYEGDMPPTVSAISNKSREFTHEEFLNVLTLPEWTDEEEQT